MKIMTIILSLLLTSGLSAQTKLFKSKTMPVSINYPSGWKVTEEGSIAVERVDEKGYIRIRKISSNGYSSAEKLLAAIKNDNYTRSNIADINEGEININNEKALFIEAVYKSGDTVELHYVIQRNDQYYYLYSVGNKVHKEEAVTILKSFKIQAD